MMTPWAFLDDINPGYYFPVIHEWVTERQGLQRRDMRNIIAHTFNTGNAYRDLDGELPTHDEEEKMFIQTFSATKFWDLLEVELEPLVKELEFAIGIFSEQVLAMPKEVGKVKEIVVEDMSAPIPEEWSQGDAAAWVSTESSRVEWVPGVDETWESGIEESWVVRRWRLMASFLRLI
jgi:hypothetical protein